MLAEFDKPFTSHERTLLELSFVPYLGIIPDAMLYSQAVQDGRWAYVAANTLCVPLSLASRLLWLNLDLGPWLKHKYATALPASPTPTSVSGQSTL